MNKNIVVTGGAGYIGSHACQALKNSGYIPITVDNLSSGWADAVKFGPLEVVDLLDQRKLKSVFEKYQPSAVMHFAARSQVAESVIEPGKYWRNNFLGSLNLIEACIEYDCTNFIMSSTCATYGDQDNVILDEDSEQRPINAYGASKRAAEEILEQFSVSTYLSFVIFRYFNVAGADPSAEIGEYHQPETHLIPIILDTIGGNREPLKIYGTDYPTPDGTCIRDYVHVNDIADAHILGLKWLEAGKVSRSFNLGTGTGFSVREVIEQAKTVTKRDVPFIEIERRFGDCMSLVSGSFAAKDQLGWRPQRSTLNTMIKDAWRWHQFGGYSK